MSGQESLKDEPYENHREADHFDAVLGKESLRWFSYASAGDCRIRVCVDLLGNAAPEDFYLGHREEKKSGDFYKDGGARGGHYSYAIQERAGKDASHANPCPRREIGHVGPFYPFLHCSRLGTQFG